MRRLWYMPLESYKERYTCQLSAPQTGWLERNWLKEGINYVRVEGDNNYSSSTITDGSVLDATNRGMWSCSQIQKLLHHIKEGHVTSEDVIYFDDFWTPGIEALTYAFDLIGIHPQMYAMLHAQSVDKFDFTYPMRKWIRHFEIGIGKILSGIFVTSTCLQDLCIYHNVGGSHNIFLCGLPYNSQEVLEHFPIKLPIKRQNQVIYSSRWDKEKDPGFFMDIMETMLTDTNQDINFVISTSAKELKSNEPELIKRLKKLINKYPENIELREGCSKEEYYFNLLQSKVQINTANQDFVSWTLLEATTCGCRPLYPNYLSFPEALQNDYSLMYEKRNLNSAIHKLKIALEEPLKDYSHIYKPFDNSWKRMLSIMQNDFNYWLDNPLFEE